MVMMALLDCCCLFVLPRDVILLILEDCCDGKSISTLLASTKSPLVIDIIHEVISRRRKRFEACQQTILQKLTATQMKQGDECNSKRWKNEQEIWKRLDFSCLRHDNNIKNNDGMAMISRQLALLDFVEKELMPPCFGTRHQNDDSCINQNVRLLELPVWAGRLSLDSTFAKSHPQLNVILKTPCWTPDLVNKWSKTMTMSQCLEPTPRNFTTAPPWGRIVGATQKDTIGLEMLSRQLDEMNELVHASIVLTMRRNGATRRNGPGVSFFIITRRQAQQHSRQFSASVAARFEEYDSCCNNGNSLQSPACVFCLWTELSAEQDNDAQRLCLEQVDAIIALMRNESKRQVQKTS